jgi:hypothetical protein
MAPRRESEHQQAPAHGPAVVVALRGIDDAQPEARGRQWADADFATRDAVLADLGLRPFGRRRRAQSRTILTRSGVDTAV